MTARKHFTVFTLALFATFCGARDAAAGDTKVIVGAAMVELDTVLDVTVQAPEVLRNPALVRWFLLCSFDAAPQADGTLSWSDSAVVPLLAAAQDRAFRTDNLNAGPLFPGFPGFEVRIPLRISEHDRN